jgi:AcrR family transcriptional regulator
MARKYEMKARARQVEETRRKIAAAAAELHGSVGPARTTISAVAERAGVERLTVYRHFPDEAALFRACSGLWLEENPPPDPSRWSAEDPGERLRAALSDLYAWYRRNARMMENSYRDLPLVDGLRGPMEEWEAYLDVVRGALLRGQGVRGKRRSRLAAAVGHALDFRAWASLARQGLDDAEAVDLMVELVRIARG